MAKTLFDADVADEAHAVGTASLVIMEDFRGRLQTILRLPAWVPTAANRRSRDAIGRLDEVVYRIIAARRRSGEDRGDLLSMLLQAQDADDGVGMTDRQLRDEVMTLFMAGHETTAVALSWAWYLLAQHTEVDARLAEELRAVLGASGPTTADLPRLPYTAQVVTETMRLYPPAYGMGRQAVRRSEVVGHSVAKGVIIIVPTWVVHRDPRWFEEPEAFRPERWADELARHLPRYVSFAKTSYDLFGGLSESPDGLPPGEGR